jgi:hypothetical protein
MPRAHSIFILRHVHGQNIEGAWTVKRELSEWLDSKWAAFRENIELNYEVIRLRDGAGSRGVIIPWKDIP